MPRPGAAGGACRRPAGAPPPSTAPRALPPPPPRAPASSHRSPSPSRAPRRGHQLRAEGDGRGRAGVLRRSGLGGRPADPVGHPGPGRVGGVPRGTAEARPRHGARRARPAAGRDRGRTQAGAGRDGDETVAARRGPGTRQETDGGHRLGVRNEDRPGRAPPVNDHRERRPSRPQRGRPAPRKEGPRRPPEVDAPRQAAFDVLRAVREKDAYANLVLPDLLRDRRITGRDAALATELTYGASRAQGLLDAVIESCAERPLSKTDPNVLDALRLGVYQLLRT